jgi:hypothetical protein
MLETLRPKITWLAVPTAAGYIVNIVDAATNTDLLTPTTVTGLTYTPNFNLPQTPVTIRVRANDGSNDGPWSAVTITLRLGNTPSQNAIVLNGSPTFAWATVPDAEGYHLQIDNDPFFDNTATGGNGAILRDLDVGEAVTYTLAAPEVLTDPGVYYWRVKPDNGAYPAQTASRSFAWVDAAGLKPANLLTKPYNEENLPADMFNEDVAVIAFFWDAIAPAPQMYQLQISDTTAFATLGTLYYTTDETALPVSITTFIDGRKYWRVRGLFSADGTSFGPWSDVKTITIDRVAPQPPIVAAPLITATSSTRPVFKWAAPLLATQYFLSFRDTRGGVTGLNNLLLKTITVTAPTALNQNNVEGYKWSVRAGDVAGNFSGPSIERTLYVFSGLTPTRGQRLLTPTPTFTWTGVTGPGAASWIVEVSRDLTFTQMVYKSSELAAATTRHLLPSNKALSPGVYFWRVYRTIEDTSVIWGQPFYVGSGASITPRLVSPLPSAWINAVQMTAGQEFRWEAQLPGSPAINTAPLAYRFELAKSLTFAANTIVYSTEATSPSFILPNLALTDGTYYWRVRARYSGEMMGSFSAPSAVRIDRTLPGRPVLLAPVVDAIVTHTHTPTLRWMAAPGTTGYVIEVATDTNFNNIRATKTVNSLTLSSIVPSLTNGIYYWRVIAKDAAGNATAAYARRLTIAGP